MISHSHTKIRGVLAHHSNVCTNTHVCPDLQACMRSSKVASMWRDWNLDRIFDVKVIRAFWQSTEEHKGSGPGSDLHRRISEPYSRLWFNLFIRCLLQEYTKARIVIQKRTGVVGGCAAVLWSLGSKEIYTWHTHGSISHKSFHKSPWHSNSIKSLFLFFGFFLYI